MKVTFLIPVDNEQYWLTGHPKAKKKAPKVVIYTPLFINPTNIHHHIYLNNPIRMAQTNPTGPANVCVYTYLYTTSVPKYKT